MNSFELLESNVRSYSRVFGDVFRTAKNSMMFTEEGKCFLDFFAGAGALNYGHNPDFIKGKLLEYIGSDAVVHGLDMYTTAKRTFIETFNELILAPKGLDYKLMFCGPTGTNAVEAALKLARKAKKRTGIFSFSGGFHGMSYGSLAATGNLYNRGGAGAPLNNVTFMPYPYGFNESFDTIGYMENVLTDANSGIEKPAAVILETVQAEGGVIVAPVEWLKRLSALCKAHDILLIVDDIQVGCGRTGSFFSFERAGIQPDLVVLSKSISGYGLPMSLLLLKPELDVWQPGEHNGTFRGNQLAFVGATAALEFRISSNLEEAVKEKEAWVSDFLQKEIVPLHPAITVRGLGLIWGIDLGGLEGGEQAAKFVASRCYDRGLIIERSGRNDTVVKLMPALTIDFELLEQGCAIVKEALAAYFEQTGQSAHKEATLEPV
ncbi:diaminobutyrate--2-oxoglutarate transaminase [Paenibacillus sp. UNC499MF]|uniref:diaminobutyrate--2-oxoglutarate transaminase n=1 Tax=Paenibacillus sp. UNC499MF TaxID=1502751 RepID=UPI0008A035F6|nr:diaminobutyrate--2-oxoglutarate transaminase [Paenibacillus sp. UNC499MF]SEG44450.1 diaminobutyrate-2-oxoglutarate transaminase [Paenibacillus sp. UNC499MF]